jgi:mannitol-specific phosphotransferase system IIBC component
MKPEQFAAILIGPPSNEDNMTMIPASLCNRMTSAFRPAVVLASIASVLSPASLAAQGLPVQNGPMIPVALWWIGAFILGLAMAYGILRNRRRTRSEKDLTERAAKQRYAEEERDRVQSGSV